MYPERYISDGISFLSEDERAIIKKDIIEKYHSMIRAKGAQILVAPYISPKKTAGGIILTDSIRSEDQFHSTVCQVIDIGPLAYTNEKFTDKVMWCDIGDWVVVPRTVGNRLPLSGLDIDCIRIVSEDHITAIVKDPLDFQIKISATKY